MQMINVNGMVRCCMAVMLISCCCLSGIGCANRKAALFAARADSAYAAGDRAMTLRCYEQCLALDPANRQALTRTAEIYEARGEFDNAMQRWYTIGDRGYQPESTASRMTSMLAQHKIKADYYLIMAANLQQSRLSGQVVCYCDSVLDLAPQQPQALQLRVVAQANIADQQEIEAESMREAWSGREGSISPAAIAQKRSGDDYMHPKMLAIASRCNNIYTFRSALMNDPGTTASERSRILEVFQTVGVPERPDSSFKVTQLTVIRIMNGVSAVYRYPN